MTRRGILRTAGASWLTASAAAQNPLFTYQVLLPDIVVVIPGILGSVLQKGGRDLWALSGTTLLRAVHSPNSVAAELSFKDDSPEIEDVGDGVVASRLIADPQVLPGFWRVDRYTALISALKREFDLRSGENFFEFPYDWRRDNRVAAKRLAKLSSSWLKKWRESSGNPQAKLCILAHSMGGLVARYFVECLEGWQNTHRLITFAAPFRGSLKALNTLSNGFELGGIDLTSLTRMGRTLTSIYQLLPQYECYDAGQGRLRTVGESSGVPGVDQQRAAAALDWHRYMDRCAEENRKNPKYAGGYRLHPIVGAYQKTFQAARLVNGRIQMMSPNPDVSNDGDGTVPELSAVPPEVSLDQGVYVAQLHASIQNDQHVIDHVLKILRTRDLSSAVRGIARSEGFQASMEVGDVFTPTEPIVVTARCPNAKGVPNVIIENAQTGMVVRSGSMSGSSGDYSVAFRPLPEGAYRITLEPNPANARMADVFAVVSRPA